MTKKPKIKKPIKLTTILSAIVLFFMVTALVVAASGFAYVSSVVANAPTVDPSDFESQQSTKIYDKDGILIADIGMEKRDLITYDDLSQSTVDAFLAIEDSRFFEHNGFDVPRFIKVSLETLTSGEFGAGGSTVTMQLIKNTYFSSPEQLEAEYNILEKINRKIQEIYMALEAEKVLSKHRILELYLNKINYGVPGNKRGIQTAAQYYFGKNVSDLNLVESAMLAGIINKPGRYNPMATADETINYVKQSMDRTKKVLYLMWYHGYITEAEYDQAVSIDLTNLLTGSSSNVNTSYQSYVDTVINEVTKLTGQNPVDVPMIIYTNMDRELQDQVEEIQNGTSFAWYDDRLQTAMITIDNRTGAIMAIGGGRFYNGERLFNRATDMFRQAGSTMKGVLSYPLAFEYLGWSTKQVLSDEPYSFSASDPKMIVENSLKIYQGDVTLDYAMGWSLNIPAILTLKQIVGVIGSAAVVEHLNNMGFTDVDLGTGNMPFDLGFAIGGSSLRVSPIQLAGAYTVIFNAGQYIQPHTVTRIEFLDGTSPMVPTYASTQIISEDAAYLVTRLLKNNVDGNYFSDYKRLRRTYPTFLKSGTTNWGEEGKAYGIPDGSSKDLWLVYGTSEYTNAVWVGYDNAVVGQTSYITEPIAKKKYREQISSLIIDKLYATREHPTDVEKPDGVVEITQVLGVFPYVAPLPNMNPALVVRSYIKKTFANLGTLQVPAVSDPTTLDLSIQNNGGLKHLTMTLNDYPDPLALIIAPNTREMSLTVKDVTITATGNRLFDYSWVYGPVKYFARIVVDGTTVDTLTSSVPILETDLSVNPGNVVTVCGYYGYETAPTHSLEVCKDVDFTNLTITAPAVLNGADISTLEAWLSSNGFTDYTISYTMPPTTDPTKLGTIVSVTNLNEGETYTYDSLKNKHFDIVVYDQVVNLFSEFMNKAYATPSYYDYLDYTQPAIGTTITSIKLNYVLIDSSTPALMLSELYDIVSPSPTTRLIFN